MSNETEHRLADRKRRLKILGIGSLISLGIIVLALILFSTFENIPNAIEVALSACLAVTIIFTVVGSLRKKEFIPITETEYYNLKYSSIR